MTNAKVIKEQTRTELLERVAFLERVAEQFVRVTAPVFEGDADGVSGASFFPASEVCLTLIPELAQYLREREVGK